MAVLVKATDRETPTAAAAPSPPTRPGSTGAAPPPPELLAWVASRLRWERWLAEQSRDQLP
jgi:hypothetical protein